MSVKPNDTDLTTILTAAASRRQFLRRAGLAAIAAPAAASVLGACREGKAATPKQGEVSGGTMPGHSMPATAAPASAATMTLAQKRANADAMDAMHEQGMKAFPAKTAGVGNQVMKPKMDKDVKVFELTARKLRWETEQGKTVEAWAYNDQVPGPQIRVKEGDRVRIVLHNELPESTVIHFHGLELPNDMDGVPFITQPPVKPGQRVSKKREPAPLQALGFTLDEIAQARLAPIVNFKGRGTAGEAGAEPADRT